MNKTALSNAPWVVPGGHRHKTKPNFQLFIYMCGVATKIKEKIESKEDFSDSSKQSTNQYRQAKVIIHRFKFHPNGGGRAFLHIKRGLN